MKNCPELQFVKKKKPRGWKFMQILSQHSTWEQQLFNTPLLAAGEQPEAAHRRVKKKNVLFNKSAEITLISQPQDNDESSAARKKKRSVRDTKQEVHSQPDAHPSFKALTKLLITQLAAGDTNAGRGETKKKVKWHLIDAHVVLKVECQSSLWASLSLSPVRGATRTLSKQRRNPPTLKIKKKLQYSRYFWFLLPAHRRGDNWVTARRWHDLKVTTSGGFLERGGQDGRGSRTRVHLARTCATKVSPVTSGVDLTRTGERVQWTQHDVNNM